jgi:hypothetical protein
MWNVFTFRHGITNFFTFFYGTSRFESVLRINSSVTEASAQAMQSLRNFPISSLPLFSVEQVSHASAHVIQA